MRIPTVMVAAILAFAQPAGATPVIVVSSTAFQCYDRLMRLPAFQPVDVEFWGADAGGDGVQGAEFAATGLPGSVFAVSTTPGPGVQSVEGAPFSPQGTRIVLSACGQTPQVLLFTVQLLALGTVPPFELQLVAHPQPSLGTACAVAQPAIQGCDAVLRCAWVASGPPNPQVVGPQPENGAGAVASPVLNWHTSGTYCYDCWDDTFVSIYLGTDANPPLVLGPLPAQWPPYHPGALLPETMYYWRIVYSGCLEATSPVWSFTTARGLPVVSRSWSNIKAIYR